MDKSKSKDNLRAAGKKRLEEFRQKKQQKGSSTKSSGSALSAPANDDKSLLELSRDADSAVTDHDNELQQKFEAQGLNLAEHTSSLAGMSESGVELPKLVDSSEDERPVPADSELERPLSAKESVESEILAGSDTNGLAKSWSNSELVAESISSDQYCTLEGQNRKVMAPECITDSNALIDGDFSEGQLVELPSDQNNRDNGLDISSSNGLVTEILNEDGIGSSASGDKTPVAFQETSAQKVFTDVAVLRGQVQILAEENEKVSNQLVMKAEQQLQDENKVKSLIAEVEVVQQELNSVRKEKVQLAEELTISQKAVQILEEDLASEQRTVQQMQELVHEKSQLVEAGRDSTEKLEALVLAKDLELEACRDQVHTVKAENVGLVCELEEFGNHLDHLKQKEEIFCVDLKAQHESSQEQLRRLEDEKVGLFDELEISKLLVRRLTEERSDLLANFDVDIEQLREDLSRMGEENTKQVKQLLESRQEVQKLCDEHAEVVKKLEIALDECRTVIECTTDEKSKAVQELTVANDQLLALTEAKGQEVKSLGGELQECKDLVRIKFQENSSLVMLLEESGGKLEKAAQSAAELAAQLEKHREVSDVLLEEKKALTAEVLEIRAQWQLMQQTAVECELELDRGRENLRVLEEDHSKLARQLVTCTDELSKLQADKTAAELEVVSYRDQMSKLEDQNSTLIKLLEGSRNELQQVSEDNLKCFSDLTLEFDKHKILSTRLLEEKERVTTELQDVIERFQLLHQEVAQSRREHTSRLEEHGKQLKEVEDSHIQLSSDLTVSRDEISKLKEEKRHAELELARNREQLRKLEDVNKDLVGGLDGQRVCLEAIVDEKAKMFSDYVTEVNKFKQLQLDSEEANVKLSANCQQLLSELQKLKNEKNDIGLELETYKGQCQIMEDEKWKLASEFNMCRDQLQFVIEEKGLGESKLGLELKECREQARILKEDNSFLVTELEDCKERLQNIHEHKVIEIEDLQQEVEALVQSQEQTTRELVETQKHAQMLEVARLELVSNEEALSQQLKKFSEVKDVLHGNLEVAQHELHELVKEKGHLALKFEAALDNWQVEKMELSRELEVSLGNQQLLNTEKAQVDSELLELMLKRHETDAQLAKEVGDLKDVMESSEQQRACLVAKVEGKDRQVQALEVDKSRLEAHLSAENQKVTSFSDELVHLTQELHTNKLQIEELESDIAQLRDDYSFSQTQVNLLTQEKSRLAEELRKFRLEFDALKGGQSQFVPENEKRSLQIHEETSLSEKALLDLEEKVSLQNQMDALQVQLAEQRADLKSLEDMASQSQCHVQSLIQKLEVAIGDILPEDSREILSSDCDKNSADYCYSLASRLHIETVKVRDDLHAQLSEMGKQLLQAERKVMILQRERAVAVENVEEIHSQLTKSADERKELETSLKKVAAIASSEKQDAVLQIKELTQQHYLQRAQDASDLVSVRAVVSGLQNKIAEQEAAMAMKAVVASNLEEELKSIISKWLSGILNDSEDSSKNLSSQLEEGIVILFKRCEDSVLQIEELRKSLLLLASESDRALENHIAQNAELNQMLQTMQEALQSRELELVVLNKSVDEQASTVAQQASEIEGFLLQIQSLNEQVGKEFAEKTSLQSGLAQAEQKLSFTREKLSLAVNKGKAVVQQRDGWKLALAEKSKELELLVSSHQHLQGKDATLKNAERKIVELAASAEQIVVLEAHCGSLQKVVSTADQLFIENDDLIHNLSRVLGSPGMPDDWQSSELVNKILWITSSASKLLQELLARKEEVQNLMKSASALTSTIKQSEGRESALVADISSLKHEKEELASRLEDGSFQLKLELHQMTEDKAQLIGTIRQLDLDVAKQSHDKEDLNKRLQEKSAEIANFEMEIDSLLSKVTEQKEELNNRVVSYHSLAATVHILLTNLTLVYETISTGELDTFVADSSLHLCKHIMQVLISNHNLTVAKIKEILHQASHSYHAFEEALQDDVLQSLECKILSREVSSDLTKRIEGAFVNIEQQAISLQTLLQLSDKLAADLSVEQNEKTKLQLELIQKEERLTTVQVELFAALSNCESLVQEQDSLKQALVVKTAELETLATAHREELQSKEVMLQETIQRLKSSLEHVAVSEMELVSSKNSVASTPKPSLMDRLSEMDRQLSETQLKANLADSDADNFRNAASLLSSEVELLETRLVNLANERRSLINDKEELVRQLESSSTQYRMELLDLVAERTQLTSDVHHLKQELDVQSQEREQCLQDCREILSELDELKSRAVEAEAGKATLQAETEILQQRVAELEMSLKSGTDARIKLEADADAVMARIQYSIQEPLVDMLADSVPPIPYNSQSSSQLESLSGLLIWKYETAMQEIQEISKQRVLLAESQQIMMDKALSDHEQLQQQLASRDLELTEVTLRLKEGDSRRTKQEDIALGVLEEVHVLRKELAKIKIERDAMQSELVQAEQKAATIKEKLGLAIKKGKGLAQQRDLLKQSLSEQQLLVSSSKEELQIKQSALEKATYDMSMSEEQVRALELKVSSLTGLAMTLEKDFQEKVNLTKKMEALLTKCNFPSEWQSRAFTEKLEWLVAVVANAQTGLIAAGQEAEALKKASVHLSSQLTDAQSKAEAEQESRSILGLKLEQSEGKLKWSQNRIVELEKQLSDVVGANHQTELLSTKVLHLEALVQQKEAEVSRAEETVIAWAERSEESEKYIHLSQERISELEQRVQELAGAQHLVELLHQKIAKLEEAVQQKEVAVKAMETSRDKAVSKLTTTVNRFRELYQQSEGLVVELERMQGNLEDSNAEIAQLKEEVVKISSHSQILQETLESRNSFLLQLQKLLNITVLSGTDLESSQPITEQGDMDQFAVRKADEEGCLANVNLLQNRLSGFAVQLQAWQADVKRKDEQLQRVRKELEDVVAERAHLKAKLQREQSQSERLKSDVASMHAPLAERGANQIEEIEEVQVGQRLLPISSPAPHVRGARKPASTDVAIDVDTETSHLLAEFDDKGHGFKSLTTSHFMPRGTRAIAEQIDRLCVAGGRMLMRQPAARLGLTLYWLAIHIWMVFLISAAHV